MKALITAFALLSFVAASTIPMVAQAQTQSEHSMAKKKMAKHKMAKKKTGKKVAHKKKSGKKMKKPS